MKHLNHHTPGRLAACFLAICPIVGILLLLFGYAIFTEADYRGPWHLRSQLIMLLGAALLGLQVCSAVACKRLRLHASSSLLVTLLLSLLLLFLSEQFLPPVAPEYTAQQLILQQRLLRRGTSTVETHRGITIRSSCNSQGWNDREWSPRSGKPRIVLIGDSFLELMSEEPLAELLRKRMGGSDSADVINLGLAATAPEDYRNRFYQTALQLDPDLVIFFVYSGNDYAGDYAFLPYSHPRLTVSTDAVQTVRADDNIAPDLLEHFSKMVNLSYKSQESFLQALGPGDPYQKQLLYELALAYSPDWELSKPRKTSLRVVRLAQRFLRRVQRGEDSERQERIGSYQQVANAFSLPRNQRLGRIAQIAAQRFGGEEQTYLLKLQSNTTEFKDTLLEEFENAVYLMTALDIAVNGNPIANRIVDPQKTAAEYAQLFLEILESATARGINVLIVLIPEASQSDAEFRDFWLPLADFSEYFKYEALASRALKDHLDQQIEIIDLSETPHALDGGYWKFDAHWNTKGNNAVADILASQIEHWTALLNVGNTLSSTKSNSMAPKQ